MRRDHRLFVGVDAADRGIHVVKRRTHGLDHAAVSAFQLLAGADEIVLRLFDLRVNHPALVQRQGEAQADFILTDISILRDAF